MAKLTPEQQEFLVKRLAMFETPTTVARALTDQFGIRVPKNQVEGYHPDSHRGRNARGPSRKLREIFNLTRAAFLADVDSIPITHRNYRLRKLNEMFDAAFEKKNHPAAAKYLEQAAKEMGDSYAAVKKMEIDHTGKVQTEEISTGDKRDMLLTRFLDAASSIAAERAEGSTKH